MANHILLLLGAAFVVSSAFLFLQKGKRNVILERLHIRRRRVSGAKTPPRSLSPGEKQPQTPEVDYSDAFPPSRRYALAETDLPSKLGTTSERLVTSQPTWTKNMVPLECSYLDAKDSMFTPCEFSIKEIKALGNFPDYAALSGVPLPKPYTEFDIKKALPRPYRPFRWAYHQTMCKYIKCLSSSETYLA